jgi:hypothetical protein
MHEPMSVTHVAIRLPYLHHRTRLIPAPAIQGNDCDERGIGIMSMVAAAQASDGALFGLLALWGLDYDVVFEREKREQQQEPPSPLSHD